LNIALFFRVWLLADFDQDGMLSFEEYAIAWFLIDEKKIKERKLPDELPRSLLPNATAKSE
jgi:hypothetical protein